MSDENSFGSMLKWARMRAQWTQQQVAHKLEVSRVTVNRWENDLQLPSAYYLKQIVALLDLKEADADALYRAAAQVPPIIDNLPFQRNPFFTGREEHLVRLGKLLQETGTAEITQSISISGLGGIGKTQLALEYAHRSYPHVYRTVLWVNASEMATLEASYYSIAQLLDLPERKEKELYQRIQDVKNWLTSHTKWLLIMDNADDLPLARSFLPSKPLGHVMYTTRSQIIGTTARRARYVEVEVMEPEKGLLFLLRRSGVLDDETTLDSVAVDMREVATQVVELLGGLPLALDQAGAYIEDTGVSFTEYIKRYRAERHRLLNRRALRVNKASEHPDSVATTFKLSFEKAYELHPLATDILNFCAFLQPDAIPVELFQHDDSIKYNTTALDDGIAALQVYSLIKHNTQAETFSMHRLAQAVLIDAMSPDLQMQLRDRVVRTLYAALRAEANDSLAWAVKNERLRPHIVACAAWTDNELTLTVEIAKFFHVASRQLLGGEETSLAQAVSIYTQLLGDWHYETDQCREELAVHYIDEGKDEQAEALLQQVLAIRVERFRSSDPRILRIMRRLMSFYYSHGKHEQAEALYQRVRQFEATYPRSVAHVSKTMYSMATGKTYRRVDAATLARETKDRQESDKNND